MRDLTAEERGMAAYALATAPLEDRPACPECGQGMEDAGTVGHPGRQVWECDCGRTAGALGAPDGVYSKADERAFNVLADLFGEPDGELPTIWVATMETQHFGFTAAGPSEDEALAALKRGWEGHVAQFRGREAGAIIVDPQQAIEEYGANVISMVFGQAYRDGAAVGSAS